MFSKILIANRGEIAVRIMQTCRELGISTVAVYSDADAHSLHVRSADEAVRIGPAAPRESYLDQDAVERAVVESGASAVHPGYGFLAENAAFAETVLAAGAVWIGPPPAVISLLGDKVAAKRSAAAAGVPVVPGTDADESVDRLRSEAKRIGYPVMLKAAAGGGGKGMRVVADESELEAAVESARREADAAFGDGRIFLEKLLERPRHVEVQILADAFGNMVHLGERDCSTQRRHQKVVEEAPSPIITAEMRAGMGDSALRLARATGYVNAGTVEFLFEGDAYYFLEVNTRLQVEHPVTELVTGVDLVRMQIEIAAGQRLAISQEDVQLRGHAIEARVYAEDPDRRFLPTAGPVHIFRPPNGPGARNDVGVAAGDAVTSFYDPLMAKLIVHAETRPLAVARLRDALHRYDIAGPTTNLAFLRWIAGHPRFHDGRVDITFVDEEWQPSAGEGVPNEALIAAALADALGMSINDSQPNSDAEARPDPWRVTSGWRAAGMSRTFAYSYAEHCWNVGVTPLADGTWQVVIGEDRYEARVEAVVRGRMVFRLGSAVFEARADSQPDARTVSLDGRTYVLTRPTFDGGAQGMNSGSDAGLNAPMPGTIVKIVVAEGQTVEAREPLVILEAMKMEHVIEAPHAGVVRSILYREGDLVPAGAPLVRLESP